MRHKPVFCAEVTLLFCSLCVGLRFVYVSATRTIDVLSDTVEKGCFISVINGSSDRDSWGGRRG